MDQISQFHSFLATYQYLIHSQIIFRVLEQLKTGHPWKLNHANILQVLPHKNLNPTENLCTSGIYTITYDGTVFRLKKKIRKRYLVFVWPIPSLIAYHFHVSNKTIELSGEENLTDDEFFWKRLTTLFLLILISDTTGFC